MNICVFCSAQEVAEHYKQAASEFATLIGEHGHALVWGGSDRGLMKVVADGVQQGGGKIIGISIEFFKHKARANADEMIFATDLSERKSLLLERSDATLAMVGGIGTLDEITEVLALKRHGTHHKPIVFLNTNGFYDGLKEQLIVMEREGFLENMDKDVVGGLDGVVFFADTPQDAMRYIEAHA